MAIIPHTDPRPPRSTPTSTVPRTAAATATRRRARLAKVAHEMACRVDDLDDRRLAVLAGTLVAAALQRGLAVPDLRV